MMVMVCRKRATSTPLYRRCGMLVALGVVCGLGGCSSWNNEVEPANVAPEQYAALTCAEMSREIRKLNAAAKPTLFPSNDWEAKRALAKGQIKALQTLSADMKCKT